MAAPISLATAPRAASVRAIRDARAVPAVAYGAGLEVAHFQIDENALRKAFREAGHSAVVELEIAGKKHGALIQEIIVHDTKPQVLHADFRFVKMDETVRAEVAIKIVGEAPAVKNLGGVLIHGLEQVEVEGKPAALVPEIEADVSGLAEFHAAIHASDLPLPAGLTLITDPTEMIASVIAPRGAKAGEDEEEETETETEATGEAGEKSDAGA